MRRIFCLNVNRSSVFEWAPEIDGWRMLALSSTITDRCLVRPLAVRALLDAAVQDDEVAEALMAKKNPVIERAIIEGFDRGKLHGFDEGMDEGKKLGIDEGKKLGLKFAVEAICSVLGVEVDETKRVALETRSTRQLEELLASLKEHKNWPDT